MKFFISLFVFLVVFTSSNVFSQNTYVEKCRESDGSLTYYEQGSGCPNGAESLGSILKSRVPNSEIIYSSISSNNQSPKSTKSSTRFYKCKNPITGEMDYQQVQCSNDSEIVKTNVPFNIEEAKQLYESSQIESSKEPLKAGEAISENTELKHSREIQPKIEINSNSKSNLINEKSDIKYEETDINYEETDTEDYSAQKMDSSSNGSHSEIRNKQLIKFTFIAIGLSFVILLLMGMTNKIIIFYDGKDLVVSLGVYLVPLIGIIFAAIMAPAPENTPADYSPFIEYLFYGIGGLGGVICLILSFKSSVEHNGIMLGIIVAIFKNIASIVMILFVIGWISKAREQKYRSLGEWVMMYLILGLFGWVVRKLVNGQAVEYKKMNDKS
jgi:hypothetical protein